MILGKVMGAEWGTKTVAGLSNAKILRIRPLLRKHPKEILALDKLDAGIGDIVICGTGTRLRNLTVGETVAVKTVILGIVDGWHIDDTW